MGKEITKERIDAATKDELLDLAAELGIEDKVHYKDKKAVTKRKVTMAFNKLQKEAEKAIAPEPEPTPALAVPADTDADWDPLPGEIDSRRTLDPAPEVVPGTVKPVEPTYKYTQGGNGWSKTMTREEAIAKVVKLGAAPTLVERLEREAHTGRPSKWRTSVPMRGRLPASFYLRVEVA